jgi:hypothetical protein
MQFAMDADCCDYNRSNGAQLVSKKVNQLCSVKARPISIINWFMFIFYVFWFVQSILQLLVFVK